MAHDSEVAIAAVAVRSDYFSVGVDVEPARALDPDLMELVATSKELQRIEGDPYRGRLLFAVKEAIYKAVYPLDEVFLDHHDVEVNLETATAVIRNGRTVTFRYCTTPRIVVLAVVPASAAKP